MEDSMASAIVFTGNFANLGAMSRTKSMVAKDPSSIHVTAARRCLLAVVDLRSLASLEFVGS